MRSLGVISTGEVYERFTDGITAQLRHFTHEEIVALVCDFLIRFIGRVQGREFDFERYYQGLFATYTRCSALKGELRKAVEGPPYRRKG